MCFACTVIGIACNAGERGPGHVSIMNLVVVTIFAGLFAII